MQIERGYVRPEDEEPVAAGESDEGEDDAGESSTAARPNGASATSRGPSPPPGQPAAESDEEDEGVRPLSDRLMTELTAHRTVALREAVANDPDTAFLAMLHALALKLFYRFGLDTCLEVEAKSVLFGAQVEGLGDMPYATAIDVRHGTWAAQLPKDTAGLWDDRASGVTGPGSGRARPDRAALRSGSGGRGHGTVAAHRCQRR